MLFLSNLSIVPWTHQRTLRRHAYTIFDKFLFSRPRGVGKCSYTKGLWAAWGQLCQFLQYNIEVAHLPTHWMIKDTLSTLQANKVIPKEKQSLVASTFGKLGVRNTTDLWNREQGQRRDFSAKISCLRNVPAWLLLETNLHLADLHKAKGISLAPTKDFEYQEWWAAKTDRQKQQLSNKKAYWLLSTFANEFQILNHLWGV